MPLRRKEGRDGAQLLLQPELVIPYNIKVKDNDSPNL